MTNPSENKEYVLKPEEGVAGKFISTSVDENGLLKEIQFHNDDNFNLASFNSELFSALLSSYFNIIANS